MQRHEQGMRVRLGGFGDAPYCRTLLPLTVLLLTGWSRVYAQGPQSPAAEPIWSRFIGGTDYDYVMGIAVDSRGNTIVAGDTRSNVFCGVDTPAGADAFVAAFDADGHLIWATCIGGRGGDSALNLAVDAADHIVVTGLTASDDMPMRTNAYHGETDAFAARLDPDGNLLWTTYLGGNDTDQGFGIAVDGTGRAVIAGYTESKDFEHRRNSYFGGSFDGFVALLDVDGGVQWVAYFGWLGSDFCSAVTLYAAGNCLAVGTSSSATLPQAINGRIGADDAFVAIFAPDGVVQQSRFLGGTRADRGCDIIVSRLGQILVAGDTESTDIVGARNTSHGRKDAFISILDSLDGPVRTTYFGGNDIDNAWAIAEDASGNILLAGSTYSPALASSNNTYGGGQEGFLAAFTAEGTLLFSSYLGGGGDDCAFGIAVDGVNQILAAGSSGSTNFIGAKDYNGGSRDGFVVKWPGVSGTAPDLVVTHALTEISGVAGERASVPVQVENTGVVDAVAYGPGYFRTTLYLANTVDADWDNLDSQNAISSFNLTGLAAAAVHEGILQFDVPQAPGTYFLRVRTDDYDSVPEEREYNNWGQIITLTVIKPVGRPDLIVVKPAQQEISVIRGRSTTIDVQIKNAGQSDAVASEAQYFITRLYVANDPNVDWNSLSSEEEAIERAALAVGASYATEIIFTADMNEGTYYLRARVDEADAVAEENEDNNWGDVVTLNVLEEPALPDLTIVGENGMAVNGEPGQAVSLMVNVHNIGDANAVGAGNAPIAAALYLANYAGVNWSTLPNRNRVATADLSNLAAGAVGLLMFDFTAPPETGAYCLRARIDTANAVEELNEDNNWGPIVPLIVAVESRPDIVASFADANDITRRPLENVDVTVHIANSGSGPANPSPAAYFETLLYLFSETGAIGDANSVGLLWTGMLEPHEVQSGVVTFPAPAKRGTYYLQARVDIADHIRESNEYNNLTPRLTLVVEDTSGENDPPVLTDIAPKTVAEGQTLTFALEAFDPDGDELSYFAAELPRGATFTDGIFTWTPDYDQARGYEYTVVFYVTDGTASDWTSVAITVTNMNRRPEINLPGDIAIDENQPLSVLISATDPDGDMLVISAASLPVGATFAHGLLSWTPTYSQAGEYAIRFTASDGHADGEAAATVNVTVNNVNRAPVADAGADQVVSDLDRDGVETVVLNGHASQDADGDTLTYRWTNAAGSVLATTAAPAVSFPVGVHVVTLTVTDAHGSSHADTVTIEVRRINQPPIAWAGEDQTLIDTDGNGVETVTLDGSASTDPDGTIVTRQWLLQQAVIATGATAHITLPVGTFTIMLRVIDDAGAVSEDTVTVTVQAQANTAPVISPVADQTVKENQKVTFEVKAEDIDGDAVVVSAANLPAGATFKNGVLTFRPWYDQSGVYKVTFTATDGRAQDTLVVTINVQDVGVTRWYDRWLQVTRTR